MIKSKLTIIVLFLILILSENYKGFKSNFVKVC